MQIKIQRVYIPNFNVENMKNKNLKQKKQLLKKCNAENNQSETLHRKTITQEQAILKAKCRATIL